MNPSDGLAEKARRKSAEFKQLAARIRKKQPAGLDEWFAEADQEAFAEIDCLQCAQCCKTTPPMLFEKDIERLAGHLRMRPGKFVEQYLVLDTDGIYAMRSTPCPFLGADNYCSVYEHRPKACREFPHTTHRRMYQKMQLAVTNAAICPAVFRILEKLQRSF
jgi:hypothetical protein